MLLLNTIRSADDTNGWPGGDESADHVPQHRALKGPDSLLVEYQSFVGRFHDFLLGSKFPMDTHLASRSPGRLHCDAEPLPPPHRCGRHGRG